MVFPSLDSSLLQDKIKLVLIEDHNMKTIILNLVFNNLKYLNFSHNLNK